MKGLPVRRGIQLFACLALAACGGSTTLDNTTLDGGGTYDGGACTWPARYEDGGRWACTAKRALLFCTAPEGGGCGCLSDDPTHCLGCPIDKCQNYCGPDEYALACGGIGPGPPADAGDYAATLPAGCRNMAGPPGGGVDLCCPCE